MIGLKRGVVELLPYDAEWETEARKTIEVLKGIFGDTAVSIQHIGSTAVPSIKAKPIIDIAVGVTSIEAALALVPALESAGFIRRHVSQDGDHLFFSCVGDEENVRTHHVHVVPYGENRWVSYVALRDYLKSNASAAKEYESLKEKLASIYPEDRATYTEAKKEFLRFATRKAVVYYYLGKTVRIEIDRPVGFLHEKKPESILYPINYGYIPRVLGGDDEELDVYLLGVAEPVSEYTCRIIGIVHRSDDVEDKLIGVPEGMWFTREEMASAVDFQEKYHDSTVEVL